MPQPASRVLLLSGIGTRVNPYLNLLRDGLQSAGAQVDLAASLDGIPLLPFAGGYSVVHIHWLERYGLPPLVSMGNKTGPAARLARRLSNSSLAYQLRRWQQLRTLFARLAAFQAAGGCVAYTLHNLDAHERVGWAERWGAQRLVAQANVLHVHDSGTAEALAARTGRRAGVSVIPHGHYLDAYPNTVSREEARSRLGLPEAAFVYLSLGLVRPYKGQEELLPAFESIIDPAMRLVIAGKSASPSYAETLRSLAGDDPRILLDFRFVPPEEVQVYMNATDVCVLPYRQITTSGAALLALSFGVPVIAPAIGAFPNLVGGQRGLLYNPADPAALKATLLRAREIDWSGAREDNMRWAAQWDWARIGAELIEAYEAARPARVARV